MPAPVIILVRPQLAENIGAVARAMGNFGFSELRLVAPRDGWPQKRAFEVASDGASVLEKAKAFPDLVAAMHDVQVAYAATARSRDMRKRVVAPEEMVQEISSPWKGEVTNPAFIAGVAGGGHAALQSDPHPTLPLPGGGKIKTAFVFGPERTGLENEEIVMCDAIVTIPTAKNPSLNLAQSAVVMMYEWFSYHPERADLSAEALAKAEGESKDLRRGKAIDPSTSSLRDSAQDEKMATKKDWQELFAQLEQYLEEVKYYRTAHKKPVMRQNMENMLLRGAWSEQEVRTFRGLLRVLAEGRKKGAKAKKR